MASGLALAVVGTAGRMGRMICEVIGETADATLGAALERADHELLGSRVPGHEVDYQGAAAAAAALASCDAMIAFTTADGVEEAVATACAHKLPLVIGTTGMDTAQQARLAAATAEIAVLAEPNMSIGIHVVAGMLAAAGKNLRPPQWDVEISDIHHRAKVDTPSGTALRLGEIVREAREADEAFVLDRSHKKSGRGSAEIGITSARCGDVVGEHSVVFAGPGEQIVLTHRALSRRNFAAGAVFAARKLAGQRAGSYSLAWALGEGED